MIVRFLLVGALSLGIAPVAQASDVPTPRQQRTVALTIASSAMASIPTQARIRATPAASTAGLTVLLQVRQRAGFVTIDRLTLDRRGVGTLNVVSSSAGLKDYRAVLLSRSGKRVSASRPVAVTWDPLTYSATLTCQRESAPVTIRIPCAIDISPTVALDGVVVVLEQMTRSGWLALEAFRAPPDGQLATDVRGLTPGSTDYRVVMLKDARPIATSGIVSITYTAGD